MPHKFESLRFSLNLQPDCKVSATENALIAQLDRASHYG
jgi:hypothetical protein